MDNFIKPVDDTSWEETTRELGLEYKVIFDKLKAWSEAAAAAGYPAQTNARQGTQARIMLYMKPGCQAAA